MLPLRLLNLGGPNISNFFLWACPQTLPMDSIAFPQTQNPRQNPESAVDITGMWLWLYVNLWFAPVQMCVEWWTLINYMSWSTRTKPLAAGCTATTNTDGCSSASKCGVQFLHIWFAVIIAQATGSLFDDVIWVLTWVALYSVLVFATYSVCVMHTSLIIGYTSWVG